MFLIYDGTTQRTCLRLMGRKMLVALMMECKFSETAFMRWTADALTKVKQILARIP
jgi:hypothetical protein